AVVAYRGHHRWLQTFEPIQSGPEHKQPGLRRGGVYLITGGLGRVGLLLAEYLVGEWQAKVALLGRSELPPRSEWPRWLAQSGDNGSRERIEKIQALEQFGTKVLVVSADVADEIQMKQALAQIRQRFGQLHGVFHAAGVTNWRQSLSEVGRPESERQFRPKVSGLQVLQQLLPLGELDFCLLFSSNAAILGGLGLVAYAAANSFMDAFAESRLAAGESVWRSVNWDGWPTDGQQAAPDFLARQQFVMNPRTAIEAVERTLSLPATGRLVVSVGELAERLAAWVHRQEAAGEKETPARAYPRPQLPTSYVAPGNEIERQIVCVWQELLGVEQIGIHDNFFELGGHSLLGTQLVSRLRQSFQVNVPLQSLFESATVAELGATIAENLAARVNEHFLAELEKLSPEEIEKMLTGSS
ncbi:MAG: SDR family NAD(P)-dependent oxidoreductase, partial [Chloroflexi bacterium]|nr:SDR family NAD(P)-dependent oxidoreductase [Chloroflexota bacterium]